ncbi:hypothetical protein ACNOYE_38675 [Nannocystaceae bacterium ST9]
MHGLIAALWLSLAPPAESTPPGPSDPPAPAPASGDAVIDIAPPSVPQPMPVEPAPTSVEVAPRPPPFDDHQPPPPPPPPPRDPQFSGGGSLQIASNHVRRRRPPREPRTPSDFQRFRAKPWGKNHPERRSWAAPLASAFLPGLGQIANGHVLKGAGILYGTFALVGGTLALYQSENDGTRPRGAEYARLSGYGVVSTALPLMWLFAIADAARWAKDLEVAPVLDYKLRVSFSRSMTVGFRADPDRPGFYDEWTGALMGQVAKRWSFGLSDLTLKPDGWRVGVVQFGVRADYRVFDRRRIWIDVGLGTAMQVRIRRGRDPLDPTLAQLPSQTKFGAVPYAQVDFRWFVLSRLSLDLVPRLSVPLTTRYYSADRSLPRFAPTLELGASASVYF